MNEFEPQPHHKKLLLIGILVVIGVIVYVAFNHGPKVTKDGNTEEQVIPESQIVKIQKTQADLDNLSKQASEKTLPVIPVATTSAEQKQREKQQARLETQQEAQLRQMQMLDPGNGSQRYPN